MVHGWMRRVSERLVSRRRGKRKHAPAFLRYMGSGLHAEIACRKVYAVKTFERRTNSMQAKQEFGDGRGRNYAHSKFSNLNRQNAMSRVSAVKKPAARGESNDNLAV